jgi:hypothetical protein
MFSLSSSGSDDLRQDCLNQRRHLLCITAHYGREKPLVFAIIPQAQATGPEQREFPAKGHRKKSKMVAVHNCTAPSSISDRIDLCISELLVLGKWVQAWDVFGQSTAIT